MPNRKKKKKSFSFIIVEFSFHAEKKKFIVWKSENLFSCPRAGKQAVFQLLEWKIDEQIIKINLSDLNSVYGS